MLGQRLEASMIGLDNLGFLDLSSGWVEDIRFREVCHQVPTDTIYVEPRSVLYWDAESDRPNSLKRFAHMLRLRGVATLSRPESYHESINYALTQSVDRRWPSSKRIGTLSNLARRYHSEAREGQRITRLATSTARILFHYEPPLGDDLIALHRYLLDV